MLTKNEFTKLRKEIVLNSLFLKDYSNSLFIKEKTAFDFFDSAIEGIDNERKENNLPELDVCDITIDMLYDYYKNVCCDDPLKQDDYIGYYELMTCNAIQTGLYIYAFNEYKAIVAKYKYSVGSAAIITKPRAHKIYYNSRGAIFIKFENKRCYIKDFMRA